MDDFLPNDFDSQVCHAVRFFWNERRTRWVRATTACLMPQCSPLGAPM